MNTESYIIIILLFLNIISLLIGYILGKINNLSQSDKPVSFFTKNNEKNNSISKVEIDDRKYVTEIDTKGLEKKYSSIGETKESTENISSSIDKLKNLKR